MRSARMGNNSDPRMTAMRIRQSYWPGLKSLSQCETGKLEVPALGVGHQKVAEHLNACD